MLEVFVSFSICMFNYHWYILEKHNENTTTVFVV